MPRQPRKKSSRVLTCERLEARCVLSTFAGLELGDVQRTIVAGDPNGTPADSPALRVDLNSLASPFAGVGSLQINTRNGTYICTATPFSSTQVLTAAHCLDFNDDGKSDQKDGITSVYFNLNIDVDLNVDGTPNDQIDYKLKAGSWRLHPDYTGFAKPSVNDDLAVITLADPLPPGIPIYELAPTPLTAGTTIHMVGYGRSGDGVNGYTVGAWWTVKRYGQNVVDAFYGQDDGNRPAANEVFRFDFDGPTGNGPLGGGTLGNNLEATLGGGDSGGPSFVLDSGVYRIIGVNTFSQGTNAPKFGSLGGGIHIDPYRDWILGTTQPPDSGGGGGGGKGGGKKSGGPQVNAIWAAAEDSAAVAAASSSASATQEIAADELPHAAGSVAANRTPLAIPQAVLLDLATNFLASRSGESRDTKSLDALFADLGDEGYWM